MKKLSFLIILVCVLSISMLVPVNAGNFRTITVDGDFSDWNGINPVSVEGDPETQLNHKAFYLANDNEYLYLRFDLTLIFDPNQPVNVTLHFDVDLNWNTGSNLIPGNLHGYSWKQDCILLDPNPLYQSELWQFHSISPYNAQLEFYADYLSPNGVQRANKTYSGIEVLEYAIPLEAFGIQNSYSQIQFAFYKNEYRTGSPPKSLGYDLELQSAGYFRTITVDGDISDWNGINPALVEGDNEIGPYLKAFYLANDNEFLYIRFDMDMENYPNVFDAHFSLYIDVDLNWTNGFSPYPYFWGDAMLIDTNPHLDSLHWKYESISPFTGELFYANYTFPNGVQRANVTYWQSNVEVFEYAIPLESLDVRNPYNQIRLAMPNELNHGPHQPSLWIVYDLELQSVIVSMNVARYKGTPITYIDSFVVDSDSNYTLIIENANLTSIEVKINGEKILQLADGNIDYEGQISSECLIVGYNEISFTPTGQPETFGIVKIKKN